MNRLTLEKKSAVAAVAFLLLAASTQSFFTNRSSMIIPMQQSQIRSSRIHPQKFGSHRQYVVMKSAASDTEMEAEINKMRAKEIREELESYGVNTKSFLEKSELADALLAARKEGKTPIKNASSSSSTNGSSTGSSVANRQERLQEEMEKCKSMKVSDLKKELESYGISTKSYFEKSEFVRAVAEARVDGVTKQAGGSSSGGQQREEPRDPSYRDVVVSKFSEDSKMALGGTVIDVKAR